jgi:hypothetical protein
VLSTRFVACALLVGCGWVCADEPTAPTSSPAFGTELAAIFKDGFNSRATLADVKTHVERAKSLEPANPAVDYLLGLVLLKRLQNDTAASSFEAALELDPTYLPARRALVRLRLIRKDTKTLLPELVDLAKLVAQPEAAWRDERHRADAAAFLGRAIGYLAKPESRLVAPDVLQETEVAIEERLGAEFLDAYHDGMEGVARDYEALKAAVEEQEEKKSERHKKTSEDKINQLKDKGKNVEKKNEDLKVTKEEAKAQLDEQIKLIDQRLEIVEKEYNNLLDEGDRLTGLIEQTRLDIGRAQTELNFRGANNAELRGSQGLIRLQQELIRYEDDYFAAEDRARELLVEGRELMVERVDAAERHHQKTGNIVRQSKQYDRMSNAVKKAAEREKKQAASPKKAVDLKGRLGRVGSYFPLDYQAEAARVLEEHGVSPEPTVKKRS